MAIADGGGTVVALTAEMGLNAQATHLDRRVHLRGPARSK